MRIFKMETYTNTLILFIGIYNYVIDKIYNEIILLNII